MLHPNIVHLELQFDCTTGDFLPTSVQYKWLEKDLSSVNRAKTPWIIVGAHRPMYNSLVGAETIAVH